MTGMTSTSTMTARIVWDTADKFLRNIVEPQEYGDYILPFTVLRRLECLLADSKRQVMEYVKSLGEMPPHLIDIAVKQRFGLSFYNVSPLDLKTIASVDDNVDKSLLSYIAGFSHNIADIWTSFEFQRLVATLAASNRLHAVVRHFSTLDLNPEKLSNTAMGEIFEDVMYRAFDKKGKAAGAFYTPRDAIKLMVDVLFASDEDSLAGANTLRSIYDPTAGSGGMLLVAQQALLDMNPDIQVTLFGQELMPSAYALGKADLLIQGGRPDAIRKGDTLLHDEYEGQYFDYVLSNPPFGTDWEVQEKSVREQAKEPGTRFSHGLPSKADGQMLFLAHCASKLSPAGKNGHGGRAAVVSNASPLFAGDVGPSSLRRWLLDHDLIDAIISLPAQMFYGTEITTYIWILDTNKQGNRKGKIQLIDGSGFWGPMKKPLGDKRREMTELRRQPIVEAYRAFGNADQAISRVFTPEDFMFRDVPVFKRARFAARLTDDSVAALRTRIDLTDQQAEILIRLEGTPWNDLAAAFTTECKKVGVKVAASIADAVARAAAVAHPAAPLAVDRRGRAVLIEGWKLTARVPLNESVDDYMRREVLPFAPDAVWDESKAKAGNEIPFTQVFYSGVPSRALADIDVEARTLMSSLARKFEEVAGR